jgi:hypothetical protein
MYPIVPTRLVLMALIASTIACHAETREVRRTTRETVYEYGPYGPNRSYRSGTSRLYVSKRSWLDGGTEVLPGDRKFSDYAFPPSVSFASQNNSRPLDRQPLSPASDLGGFAQRIPLPW